MAYILINNDINTKGNLSIKRSIVLDDNGEEDIVINGVFTTHYYIEEINTIESLRYKVTGVNVVEENFGSDDVNIVYIFTAKDLTIKNGVSNLKFDTIKKIYDKQGKDFDDYIMELEGENIEQG